MEEGTSASSLNASFNDDAFNDASSTTKIKVSLPDKSGKLRFIAPVKQYAKAQHLREDALKAVCTHLRKEVQHQEWYQPIDTVCATIKKLVEDKKPLAQVLGFSCLDDTPSPSMLKHYQAYGDCLVNALTFLSLWHNFDLLAPKIIELHTGVIKRLPRDYHIEKINFATSNISCENRKSPIIHTSNLGDTLLAREFFYPQEDRSECASNTVDIIKNTLLLVTPEGRNVEEPNDPQNWHAIPAYIEVLGDPLWGSSSSRGIQVIIGHDGLSGCEVSEPSPSSFELEVIGSEEESEPDLPTNSFS